jgi:hypothetical protein
MRELAEGVGRVIIAFSLLEHDFTIALARIFGLTMVRERALIRPMSITTKIELARSIYKEYGKRGGETERWLKFLLKDIRHCADCRNDLAHSFYGHKKGKFALVTFSGNGRLSGQPVAWSPQTLSRLADRIALIRTQIPNIPRNLPRNLKRPTLRPTSAPSPDVSG